MAHTTCLTLYGPAFRRRPLHLSPCHVDYNLNVTKQFFSTKNTKIIFFKLTNRSYDMSDIVWARHLPVMYFVDYDLYV
jgi:hypothetical protein